MITPLYRNWSLARARYTEFAAPVAIDTGGGSGSGAGGTLAPLPAPRDLQATVLPSGSIYLSWGACAPGYVTYQVRRGDEVVETDDLGVVVPGGEPGEEVTWSVRGISKSLTSSAASVRLVFPAVEEPVSGRRALEA